jgi:hypothetical protein
MLSEDELAGSTSHEEEVDGGNLQWCGGPSLMLNGSLSRRRPRFVKLEHPSSLTVLLVVGEAH